MGGALNLAPQQSKQSVERIWESLTLLGSVARMSASCFCLVISYQMGGLSVPALGEAGNSAAAARVAPQDDLRVGPPLDGPPRPLFLLALWFWPVFFNGIYLHFIGYGHCC